MTDRLYYRNAYATDFHADVMAAEACGDRMGVVLSRTAFYPTSGGQPYDTGTLGEARVIDVVDRADGTILHIVDGPVPAGRVTGRIAWDRRFDHMQQHTGQHVLSAAFDRLVGVETVSFHLGAASSTIDLSREATPAEIASAEETANQVVWEDRRVGIRVVDAEQATALPLRKDPARPGPLRIVEVDDFDMSACGGTHVARTGAIGIIAIGGVERVRGGSRVEFRCGARVLATHRLFRDAVAGSVRLLSGAPGDLPRAIERLQEENKDLRRRAKDLEARLVIFEADALAARAVDIGGLRTVIEALDGMDANGLKAVAQAVAAKPGYAAILCTTTSPVSVVVASGAAGILDAAALLKSLTARFGGKGGGRPELAQAGGLDTAPERVLEAVRLIADATGTR
jgi:alanyl-tRNA synthetase